MSASETSKPKLVPNLLSENELYAQAKAFIAEHPAPSTLELQRHFSIPWLQARHLAETLQDHGDWPRCGHKQGLKRTCILFRGHTRGHIFDV